MTRRRFPWDRLKIDETGDTGAIRKAYADALRATNVDEDIAGYAELRRARDQALWLAAQSQRGEDDDDGDQGLGDLGDDQDTDADWLDDDYDDDPWADEPVRYRPDPFAPDPALSEGQERARAAWQQLTGILYPEGEASDNAMTLAEMEEGLAALDTLIARAEEADIAEHDALDGALADLFARTWPRSAPFVEPANTAFHWTGEDGSIEERPALMFLNQRLKGMRFHDKVQQPGHPLHKAWMELLRPGRAGIADRLKVKRLDVHKLITGIRDRYPELESHLDPERVASWDPKPDTSAGGFGPSVVRWGLIAVLIGSALVRFGAGIADNDSDASAPSKEEVNAALVDAQIDIAAPEVFGPGTNLAAMREADPVFVDQLRLAMGQGSKADVALAMARLKALGAAEVADTDNLAVRAELRGLWMAAAQRQSTDVCRLVMAGDFIGLDLKLTEKQRAREQALLRQLLEAKLLSHMPKGGETRYSIPGWLVTDTLKRSRLSQDRLTAALTDPGSADRCKAETALLQAVVAAPQKVPDEVLRGL